MLMGIEEVEVSFMIFLIYFGFLFVVVMLMIFVNSFLVIFVCFVIIDIVFLCLFRVVWIRVRLVFVFRVLFFVLIWSCVLIKFLSLVVVIYGRGERKFLGKWRMGGFRSCKSYYYVFCVLMDWKNFFVFLNGLLFLVLL